MAYTVFTPINLLAATACTILLATPAVAQGSHVLGNWDVTVSSPQGPTTAPLVLKQDGEKIVGTFSSPQGDQGQGTPASGAVQAAEMRLNVSGTWNFQVETGAGSGTPAMTFKQDGEKLTGQYTGQLGDAPLTGTIKGIAIEFAIDISLEGNALHIVYSGTVDKDTMKGSVKLGDLGEGTFTAKKKT